MSLTQNLNKILSKLSDAGIPLRYKDEAYVEEDVLLDYLISAMQSVDGWSLNKPNYTSYNSLIKKDATRDIRVIQPYGRSGNRFEIESYQNGVKEFQVSIFKSFSNRRRFKKLIKLYDAIEAYYLELETGKNRNKIINYLKKPWI